MFSIAQFEELLEDTEKELIVLKNTTYSGVMSFLEKEAKEAIRAEFMHERKEWANNMYEIQLQKLRSKSESAVKKFNEWNKDPTLASKSQEDEITIKEKTFCLIQAEIAKIQAEAAKIEAMQIKTAKFQITVAKIKAAMAEAIAAEAIAAEVKTA